MSRLVLALCPLVGLLAATAHADDWTDFLGVAQNEADAGSLPLEWSDESNIAWKTPLPGPGSSSPVVLGDRIFLTCWTGYATDEAGSSAGASDLVRHLICLSRADGAELWRKSVPARQPEDTYDGFLTEHGYATNTPATDGERVFVFHGKSGVFAYSLDGEELWTADVGQESTQRKWGSAASPVVVGDLLIVNAAEESAAVYAFNVATGAQVWKSEAFSLTQSYATPRIAAIDGTDQIVLGVPGELWGMSIETGKLKWYAEVPIPGNVSPTPTIAGEVAYLVGGRPGGSAAVSLKGLGSRKGDVTDDAVLWTGSAVSYVPSPVVKDGKLYVVSDKGVGMCLDAGTGEVIEQRRLDRGFRGMAFYATPLLAGDRLYAVSRRDGLYVLKADPSLETLAHNIIESDESQFNATPVAVDGTLYLRSDAALYAIRAE